MGAIGYFLDAFGAPLRRGELGALAAGPGEAVVEVTACGLCHTDLTYFSGEVAPKHALPLVLGHEVVGQVVEAGEPFAHLCGQRVLVPAVLPCGDCELCRSGRANACANQKMPGNDVHGGFATHLTVPAAPLVPLTGAPADLALDELSVVADAVSTAYQAVHRAGLAAGDVALVVGAGGVGGFVAQIAHALGAKVVAIDVRADRLAVIAAHGADTTVNAADRPAKEVRKEALGAAKSFGASSLHHRIFECSGTRAGQELAFGLIGRCATMVQVGYTAATAEVHLSRLMAFDATIHGTWGCPPQMYPGVLELIYARKVVLSPFVTRAPMSDLTRLLGDMAAGRLERRVILDPRG